MSKLPREGSPWSYGEEALAGFARNISSFSLSFLRVLRASVVNEK